MISVDKNNYCVIMAGGIGSRFWPMSRTTFPKQFHDILGTGKTLIQMTFDRFLNVCPKENILVVTNEIYKDLVLQQLPKISDSQVLCEPFMRNTAPCVAYANFRIQSENPDAKIIVAPSDHLITNEVEFIRIISLALKETEGGNLVTLGIKPSRPDTGYGYINFKDKEGSIAKEVREVVAFEEKPNLEKATKFIEQGTFYWNSGIFIWSLKSIQREYQKHLPKMFELFQNEKDSFNTDGENSVITEIYKKCENISIDYGIMEKASSVSVLLSDFGWSDLGTWGSLGEHLPSDKNGNSVVGKLLPLDSKDNIVYSSSPEKLIAMIGVEDLIVVDTEDALLITTKKDEQRIKELVIKANPPE